MTPPLIVLVGATASGKSALAVRLALALQASGRPCEIVNADSMAVYRGMDIGTAKPTAADRAAVRHHLVDIMDPWQTATVAEFQTLARATIAELREVGTVPILVGGSALYTRAIVDDFAFPGSDPVVRARWLARADEIGPEALHAELASRHPQAAAGILPGNVRRVVRALEVIELTGDFSATLPEPRYALPEVHQFGIEVPREVMDARIAARVHRMWAEGLVDEVRDLAAHHRLREGLTASRALGYRQVLQFLDGELTEDEAREATINGTRRFARKQLGWFTKDARVTWVAVDDPQQETTIRDALGLVGA